MNRLAGKVAVVTGAARGIGRAISLRFADEGADVCAVDLDAVGLAETTGEIEGKGRRALAQRIDITNAAQVDSMVSATVQQLGRIDILVNNAGIQKIASLLEMAEFDWDRMLDVNVKAMWLCSRAVARQMIAQGSGGKIINASSRAGKTASTLPIGAYTVSKHAVIGLTRSMAVELAPHRINVNAYCPGVVDTPMWDLIDDEVARREGVAPGTVRARAIAAIPLGRAVQPAEVAGLVAFLASAESDYMTGQAVNLTGGSIMH